MVRSSSKSSIRVSLGDASNRLKVSVDNVKWLVNNRLLMCCEVDSKYYVFVDSVKDYLDLEGKCKRHKKDEHKYAELLESHQNRVGAFVVSDPNSVTEIVVGE